jgi:cytoskeletal protein CcmA (bactofilin family)
VEENMGLIRSKTRGQDARRTSGAAAAGDQRAIAAGDSLIGPDMVLTGDCRTDGSLRVNGHVKGSVQANRLSVGPTGRVDGDVTGHGGSAGEHAVTIDGRVGGAVRAPLVEVGRDGAVGAGIRAKEAVVRGRVTGTIRTEERLLLEETAIVEGDVTARRLGLKEGGQVFGTIRIGDAVSGGVPAGESEAGRSGAGALAAVGSGSAGSGAGGSGSAESGSGGSGSGGSGSAEPGAAGSGSTAPG